MTSDRTTVTPVETVTTGNNSPTNSARRGRGRGRRNNQRTKPHSQQQTNNTNNNNTNEVNESVVSDTIESINNNSTNEQCSRQHRRGGGRSRGRGRGRGGATSDSLTRHVRVLGDTTTDDNSSRDEVQRQDTTTTLNDNNNDTKRGRRDRAGGGRARHQPRQKTTQPLEDEDIRGTLTRTLSNDTHECMICCEVVYRRQATWSCDRCWAVFHLKCVRKWANNVLQQANVTTWRCPGCQHPREVKPKEYRCFCGKRADPEYSREHTPHSCGEPCGHVQRRAINNNTDTSNHQNNPDCQHPCSLRCHPGPCPPCAAMAPTTFCHCGKESYQIRCTDYRPEGISCGEICGELLGCGLHTCQRECHSGLCAPCGEREQQLCYCGRDSREAACGTGNPQTVIEADNPQQSFTGYYSCGKPCQRWYDCNKHQCESICHPETEISIKCPFSPDLVNTCPCGKQSLESLMPEQVVRTSCTDSIPTCYEKCNRLLLCGHKCQEPCHMDSCPSCEETVHVSCACHGSRIAMPCHEQQQQRQPNNLPRCDRVCGKLKECGKHRCNLRCCIYKDDPDIHICQLTCGKRLRCGIHRCEQQCHRGHCYPCLEATFDELSCPCGHTRLEPPIACGATLPKCPYPCTRASRCEHPITPHECHPDSVACSPCVFLVSRRCRCGRELVRSVPCYRDAANISCGQVCGKLLNCGGHRCQQLCHEGACDATCTQRCGKRRSDCRHPCQAQCHAPGICPINRVACEEPITVSCQCDRLKETQKCGAKGANPVVMPLTCNDECLRLIRNKKLADALQIEQFNRPAPDTVHNYEEDLITFSQNNLAFIRKLELDLASYLDRKTSTSLYLPTMKSNQRRAVHMLCQHYKMESTSIDPEPKRSVVVRRTRLSLVPTPLLSQVAGGHFPNPSINQSSRPFNEDNNDTQPRHPMVNALLIRYLKFGLTEDELLPYATKAFGNEVPFEFQWLTDEDVAVMPDVEDKELPWTHIRTMLKRDLIVAGLAGDVCLVALSATGDILWPSDLLRPRQLPSKQASSSSSTTTALKSGTFELLS